MKLMISFLALFVLASCGKKLEERTNNSVKKNTPDGYKSNNSETWSILSERPLPGAVRVVINEMEFVNECKGLGRFEIERRSHNGTIHITSYEAFRGQFFDVDIYDCQSGDPYFSEDYVDQTVIDHPIGSPIRVILRLRN